MGCTVKKPLLIKGIGIHSGQTVRMTLVPSTSGGIYFYCSQTRTRIPVKLDKVKVLSLGTNLQHSGQWIKTIEHFMAVLWFLKITDLRIEIEGEEVPIQDGSGLPLYEIIKQNGLQKTHSHFRQLVVTDPFVQFYKNDAFIMAFPSKKLSVQYIVHFPDNPLQTQMYTFKKRSDFVSEILPARTFGNIEMVDSLHNAGLALGASLENALVYDSAKYINTPRFPDEAVRHKIMDLVGDFYVSGFEVQARIIAFKSSHKTNHQFIKKLVKTYAKKGSNT